VLDLDRGLRRTPESELVRPVGQLLLGGDGPGHQALQGGVEPGGQHVLAESVNAREAEIPGG